MFIWNIGMLSGNVLPSNSIPSPFYLACSEVPTELIEVDQRRVSMPSGLLRYGASCTLKAPAPWPQSGTLRSWLAIHRHCRFFTVPGGCCKILPLNTQKIPVANYTTLLLTDTYRVVIVQYVP
ncbi:hypothetical protein F2P81_009402 [Scophthalmus maximus]|uniref:Uncharacterized protein n=1 Tax=Scophthalmus maximus TaxID=52904 RepID=A0A6A4T3K8_SCOMX|nr:hypothetical protein F2P81_009402 [Scophthalmus maximus]